MYKGSNEMLNFIGIDVSKDKFDCAWLRDVETGKFKNKVFKNTKQGHQALEEWLLKNIQMDRHEIVITLEPTGVYHEALAYYLHAVGFKLLMANPGKAKEFARSQNQNGKTDKKDSAMLARYGSVSINHLPLWVPLSAEIRELKVMMRRLDALEKDLQRELNRLEAFGLDSVSERVIASIETMVEALKQEIISLKKDIDAQIECDPQLKKDRALLETVPGIGEVVSRELVLLFSSLHFTSAKQAAAYLGLNPVPQESGKFKGRSMLSKCGPSRIRAKLYMAAITASQYNPSICAQYQRLLANGKTKMQALCAAMRKLVQIGFGVIKQQCSYQPSLANENVVST
jgi:transposase